MKNTNRFTNITLCIVLGTLFVSLSCKNITEPPALPNTQAVVSFSVAAANGRTVMPTMGIAKYRLLGGKTGAEEEQLAEFTADAATVSLETGTWHFTLNGYNTSGDIVLEGKVQDKTIVSGGNNQVVFELEPFTTGKGNARITVHFPDYMGITKVTATGDLPEASADIAAGTGTYTWEKDDIDAGYYFTSFALYKGTEKVSVVSEMVMVVKGLTSEKAIILSGNDMEASLYTKAEGTTLTEKLDWLNTNAASGGNYLVEVEADESIAPHALTFTDKSDISITLVGLETVRTITLASNGSMFTVGSGVTLALGSNITLRGRSSNTASLVYSNSNSGRLIMENGAVITGNTVSSSSSSYGGGVYVGSGTFTMNGGEITGNKATSSYSSSYGGGVYVSSGTFTMNGGEIMGNTVSSSHDNSYSYSYGGGVYVGSGTFTMNGGAITGNTAFSEHSDSRGVITSYSYGGGVYVQIGTFTMDGGKITGNKATSDSYYSRTDGWHNYYYSYSYGGGVYVGSGTFTMHGGEITGNTVSSSRASSSDSYYYSYGGGVYIYSGTFTKTSGIITGYTDDPVNGNVVKNPSGTVQNNKGHAVYADISISSSKRKEKTAGTTTELSFKYGSNDSSTWSGGWDY